MHIITIRLLNIHLSEEGESCSGICSVCVFLGVGGGGGRIKKHKNLFEIRGS